MKYKRILVALLTVVVLVAMIIPAGIASAAAGDPSWSAQTVPTAVVDGTRLNSVFVLPDDPDSAWVVGYNDSKGAGVGKDTILYTTDGGTTWAEPTYPAGWADVTLRDVAFADADEGWVVGGSGKILYSDDGGATWEEQTAPEGVTSTLYAIAILPGGASGSYDLVVVGSSGKVIKTTDSGTTWTDLSTTADLGSMLQVDVAAGDADTWWTMGKSGALKITNDGAATALADPAADHGYGSWFWQGSAVDEDTAYFACSSGTVIKTTDGGATAGNWTTYDGTATGVEVSLYGISAVSADLVFAAGDTGVILMTDDGGTTWEAMDSTADDATTPKLRSIAAYNANTAYAVGEAGIYKLAPPAPVAAFSASVDTVTPDTTVTFTDASTGTITDWLWDFGDGTTSTEEDPTHEYDTEPGTYTVTLTVSNTGGSDTETKTDYITVTGASCCAAAKATVEEIASGIGVVGMLGLAATYFHIRKRKTL